MIVLSDLVDGMCTVEERKKDTLEIINYVSNNNFETLEEHRKSIAPPPARARPSLLPPPKTAKQAKAFKAIDEMSSNFVKGTEGHTKWILNSAGDAFLTFGTIISRAWALTGEGAYGCLKFWSYVIIILALVGLSGLKILEMILKFFG